MCALIARPVGGSSAPARTEIRDPSLGLQNKLEPHVEQNPRSAWPEAEYQWISISPATSLKFSGATAVAATANPVHLAHWRQ